MKTNFQNAAEWINFKIPKNIEIEEKKEKFKMKKLLIQFFL